MYAQIGDIVLSSRYGFSGFTNDQGVTLVQQPRIDLKPRVQSTGDELIKLKFSIKLHRAFVVPETEAERFRFYLRNKEVLPITLGTGEFLGYFILETVGETLEQTLSDGTIFESTLDISAIEFPTELVVVQNQGKAIASNEPARFNTIAVGRPLGGQIVGDVVDTSAMSKAMDKDIQDSNAHPESRAQKIKAALKKLQQIDDKMKGVKISVSNAFRLVAEGNNLKNKITRLQNDSLRLRSLLQVGDMDSAMQANRDFQDNMSNVSGATSPFTKQYTLRKSV